MKLVGYLDIINAGEGLVINVDRLLLFGYGLMLMLVLVLWVVTLEHKVSTFEPFLSYRAH